MTPRSGYSIFEVLVAFAVMSMTLAVLIPGQAALLGRAKDATQAALARDLAHSRLETARVLGASDSQETYRSWRITTTVDPGTEARTVTITVRSAAGRILARESQRFGG